MKTEEEILREFDGKEPYLSIPSVRCVIIEAMKAYANRTISEHEGWKKYPENIPDEDGEYFIEIYTSGTNKQRTYFDVDYYENNEGFSNYPDEDIVAFRELPQPYQEGGEG